MQNNLPPVEELGRTLIEAGWVPKSVLAESFGAGENDPRARRRFFGISFLLEWEVRLQAAICKDGQLKRPVRMGTDIGAAVADAITSAGLQIPIPAFLIANALCQYGIDGFCAKGVKR